MSVFMNVWICQIYQQFAIQVCFSGSIENFQRMDALHAVEYPFSETGGIGKGAVCGLFSVVLCPFCRLWTVGRARTEHDRMAQFNQFVPNGTGHIARS